MMSYFWKPFPIGPEARTCSGRGTSGAGPRPIASNTIRPARGMARRIAIRGFVRIVWLTAGELIGAGSLARHVDPGPRHLQRAAGEFTTGHTGWRSFS